MARIDHPAQFFADSWGNSTCRREMLLREQHMELNLDDRSRVTGKLGLLFQS